MTVWWCIGNRITETTRKGDSRVERSVARLFYTAYAPGGEECCKWRWQGGITRCRGICSWYRNYQWTVEICEKFLHPLNAHCEMIYCLNSSCVNRGRFNSDWFNDSFSLTDKNLVLRSFLLTFVGHHSFTPSVVPTAVGPNVHPQSSVHIGRYNQLHSILSLFRIEMRFKSRMARTSSPRTIYLIFPR